MYEQEEIARSIAEMLYSTSLLALVGSDSDTAESSARRYLDSHGRVLRFVEGVDLFRLHMFNTKAHETICTLNFVTPILSVCMNRKRVVVVLETKIHLYDINTMKVGVWVVFYSCLLTTLLIPACVYNRHKPKPQWDLCDISR